MSFKTDKRKIFVLDTNVLLLDYNSIYEFDGEIVIPVTVLEELDKFKLYENGVGFNARKAVREIVSLLHSGENNRRGILLPNGSRFRVKIEAEISKLPKNLDKKKNDNKIIDSVLHLAQTNKNKEVVLVTCDSNMTAVAMSIGISVLNYVPKIGTYAEDSKVYRGVQTITVPDILIDDIQSDKSVILPPQKGKIIKNEFLILRSQDDNKKTAMARFVDPERPLRKIFNSKVVSFSGITPKNKEQRLYFDLLMDPSVELVTAIGSAGSGKAQPLDSLVLTASGYKLMGDIKVGDMVSCPISGKENIVIGVYPQGMKDVYKITFSDGSEAESCDEHLWNVKTTKDGNEKPYYTVSLNEIRNSNYNFKVPVTSPIYFSKIEEPAIDPYVLGCLLGDGTLCTSSVYFSNTEEHIVQKLSSYFEENDLIFKKIPGDNCDYRISSYNPNKPGDKNWLLMELGYLGLRGTKSDTKFIPDQYKMSSVENRIELLRGLFDTDAYVNKDKGRIEYSTASKKLADDVEFIVNSLGGVCSRRIKKTGYKDEEGNFIQCKDSITLTINISNEFKLVSLERKLNNLIETTKYFPCKQIEKIEFSRRTECQCIKVDSQEELYITNNFIVTHNTLCALAAGLSQVIDDNKAYSRLIVTRPVQPFGKDIGFLPGLKEEKMREWLSPIFDNLCEIVGGFKKNRTISGHRSIKSQIDEYIEQGIIEIEALTYIKGRSISNAFIIVDEAEDLTEDMLKRILTRVGANSKLVLTADVSQIDNSNISPYDSDFVNVVHKMVDRHNVGHIMLIKGERSSIANIAAEVL